MDITDTKRDKILSTLGLSRRMAELNANGFQTYMPPKYMGSALEERDSVHRMSEIALLHNATGLRFSYLRSESYYGDSVEYVLLGVHVITTDGQVHRVIEVDFEAGVVTTEGNQIPFGGLSKQVE